ncbi:MAG: tetratricopeptide repeat protein, partial [Spirochaetaceae bacterium]|nr:tetratricopeptide repeat protein [Spirochaetaceae bacterium]
WLPLETTLQGNSFTAAWGEGARQWREGLAKRAAALFPIREAWERYPAVVLPGEPVPAVLPGEKAMRDGFRAELALLVSRELEERVASLQAEFRRSGDAATLNRLGVLYARFGQLDKAEAQFLESARRKETAAVRFNLGSLSFARAKYKDALAHYERALAVGRNDDPKTLLAIARTQSELGRREAAAATFDRLRARDPALAERFAYLGLAAEATGRAGQAEAGGRSLEWLE